ncbi:energy transducer TonB, partial [Sphingomonas bacterium]|uniref:energy transducer TonB n=1 Tax=Sphingomonas bacterium TaxID=1895847 RepID=UPI0015767694
MPVALPAVLSVLASRTDPSGPRTRIVAFAPGEVSCSTEPLAAVALASPVSVVSTRYGPDGDEPSLPAYRFTFAIDAQGRARTIRRDAPAPSGQYIDTSDLAPALAASRFAAGAPRAGCSIRYTASVTPVETADLRTLYELASRPEAPGYSSAIRDRVQPAGSTCPRGPGQYRRLDLPAFEKLSSPPGGSAWVFLAFDVDGAGKPGNARVLGTSGDPALDRAGRRALLDDRYAPGPGYRGCTYHFFHNAPSDWRPPELPADAPADNGGQPGCVIDPKSIAGLLDGSAYPRPFLRRRIEGVAVIGYDTASWGAVGDVKVLASEPDEAFGVAARGAVANARAAP